MAKKASKKKVVKKRAAKKSSRHTARARSKSAIKKKIAALRKEFLTSKRAAKKTAKKSKAMSDALASGKSARNVVAEQMPGMRVVSVPSISDSDRKLQATAQGQGLDALRKKYFGSSAPPIPADGIRGDDADSEVVMVEPIATDANARGPGAKAVIVSNGRIIGRQG